MPMGEKFGDKDPETVEEHLIDASKAGNLVEIERLIAEEGADVDFFDDTQGTGYTALQWAVHSSQPKAVEKLLRFGADPNMQHKSGNTALQWAAHDGKVEIAKMLLAAGSDVTMENHGGYTARESAYHRAYDDKHAPAYMVDGAKQVLRMIDKVIAKQQAAAGGRKRKKKKAATTASQQDEHGGEEAREDTEASPSSAPPPMRLRKRRGQREL